MTEEHDDIQNDQETKIMALLSEFTAHRDEIKKMIQELEGIRDKVDTLIPTSLDARYQRFFEDKVKAVTSFFSSLLEMRKEIAKTIKDEIEIRRRIQSKDESTDISDMIDIRSMAKKIDEFKKDKEKHQSERFEKSKTQIIEGINIPGITDQITETINTEDS